MLAAEPVLFAAVVQAGIALAISFGAHLSVEQVGAIMAFTTAVTAVVVRMYVTPVSAGPPLPPVPPVSTP